ncbi:hypothetical protein Q5752_006603 [Cryptotrichosporon argae]
MLRSILPIWAALELGGRLGEQDPHGRIRFNYYNHPLGVPPKRDLALLSKLSSKATHVAAALVPTWAVHLVADTRVIWKDKETGHQVGRAVLDGQDRPLIPVAMHARVGSTVSAAAAGHWAHGLCFPDHLGHMLFDDMSSTASVPSAFALGALADPVVRSTLTAYQYNLPPPAGVPWTRYPAHAALEFAYAPPVLDKRTVGAILAARPIQFPEDWSETVQGFHQVSGKLRTWYTPMYQLVYRFDCADGTHLVRPSGVVPRWSHIVVPPATALGDSVARYVMPSQAAPTPSDALGTSWRRLTRRMQPADQLQPELPDVAAAAEYAALVAALVARPMTHDAWDDPYIVPLRGPPGRSAVDVMTYSLAAQEGKRPLAEPVFFSRAKAAPSIAVPLPRPPPSPSAPRPARAPLTNDQAQARAPPLSPDRTISQGRKSDMDRRVADEYRRQQRAARQARKAGSQVRAAELTARRAPRDAAGHYAALGIAPTRDFLSDAEDVEVGVDRDIKSRWHALLRQHHPDWTGEQTHATTARINAAYEAVETGALRRQYERT